MSKLAMISGASRGIGRATALRFAREGYSLSLCAQNNLNKLNELKSELEVFGVKVMAQKVDVSKTAEVEAWVKSTIDEFSSIDVLVSNAGKPFYRLVSDTKDCDYDEIMDNNFRSQFLLTRAVYEQMVSQKSGSIIMLSSIWGKLGASMESIYAASKGAIIAYTKSLAKELAPSNIRVNCVLPSAVKTDMLSCFSEEELRGLASENPLGRLAEPEEIAAVISFLAGEDASYISGQIISVDGGM